MPLVSYRCVVTYFPILHQQNIGALSSCPDMDTIKAVCPKLSEAIEMLENDLCIGRVGNYIGVYEVSKGLESYLPMPNAQPQLGQQGIRSSVATLLFKTYAKASKEVLDEFVEKLAQIHPWEHPVIEVSEIELWEPDPKPPSP